MVLSFPPPSSLSSPRGCTTAAAAASLVRRRPFIRHVGRLRTLATCAGARTRRRLRRRSTQDDDLAFAAAPPPFARLSSRRQRVRRSGCWQRAIQTRAGRPLCHRSRQRRDVTHETRPAVPVPLLRRRRRRHNHQTAWVSSSRGGPRRRGRGASVGFLALFSYFEAIIRWLSSFCQKGESKDDEPGERRVLRTGSHSFIGFILCVCIFSRSFIPPHLTWRILTRLSYC